MMQRHVIARLGEFPPGSRRIVEVDGRSIGVLNVDGRFFALRNRCPHQGAPLCLGPIGGTNTATKPYELVFCQDDEIIKCPWHGWEFEIATGHSVFNPHRVRVKTYGVTVESPLEEDPAVETFPVTVEEDVVILHA